MADRSVWGSVVVMWRLLVPRCLTRLSNVVAGDGSSRGLSGLLGTRPISRPAELPMRAGMPWDTRVVGRIFCPDFIGRVLELEALDAALERARTGGAPTVLVGGEAGIGKSRLVDEFSRRARGEALVLSGACAPFGSSPPPFTPVVEAIRAFVRSA